MINNNEHTRSTLAAVLRNQGFEVLQASSGATGVQLARTESPDLILCNADLQGVGGHLVLCAVRRDPTIQSIPFVLMSSRAALETRPEGKESEADGFLTMPFTLARLTAILEQCLRKGPESREPVTLHNANRHSGDEIPSLNLLVQPIKQILEATGLISGDFMQLKPKEVVTLAAQAHQAALQVYQKVQTWLPTTETGS